MSRPELVDLDAWSGEYHDLWRSLLQAAEGCTEITVLVGYYNRSVLERLCLAVGNRASRRRCRVRIAVGVETVNATHRTWTDIGQLAQSLREAGFKRLEIGVVPCSPTHFHTKLYRFVRHTRPVWFVGSANASGSRHELMVKLSGRHVALTDYVKAVVAASISVDGGAPARDVSTLRDFFLTGRLYYRPPALRQFTFDAYRFSEAQRQAISDALAGAGQVVNASPKATGFVFVLRRALGLEDDPQNEADAKGSHFKPLSIETVFGHWTPASYARDMARTVASASARRSERLAALAGALTGQGGPPKARAGYEAYLHSMAAFLREANIECRPRADAAAGFERFIGMTAKTLADPERRERAARALVLTDMPDIWSDESAREAFEESFFDDLAFRTQAPSRPRVVKALLRALGDRSIPSTPDDWRVALVNRLAARPWQQSEWV